MKLLLLLIASHCCGDILLNSDYLATFKRRDSLSDRIKAVFVHCSIHAILVWLWLWPLSEKLKLIASLYIFLAHSIIDLFRISLEDKLIGQKHIKLLNRKEIVLWFSGKGKKSINDFMNSYFKKWLLINIVDQSLHFLSIVGFVVYAT